MATKVTKTYEEWTVAVVRNDGLTYEKLEFIGRIELSEEELAELNSKSEQNGVRYYAA